LVPLAQALEARGHEVAFACATSFCPTVEAAGLRCFPAGLDWLEAEAERAFPELRTIPPGLETNRWWVSNIFGRSAAPAMAADVVALSRAWRPDLLVRDGYEFGGSVAAEHLGLPHASSGAGPLLGPLVQGLIGPHLAELRQGYGLPPDPGLARLAPYLVLAFMPPWLLHDQAMASPVTHFLRPLIFDRGGDDTLPAWVAHLPARPTVYVTMGTVFNRTPGVFPAVLAGLRDEPANVLVAVGRNQDPADFGPQPDNVHIERYIPQTLLFPHCDAVVTHGGLNTVLAALTNGLPMVITPLQADQFVNAQRCAELGVARVIEPNRRTPEAIRDATRGILQQPRYRENAAQLRERLQTLPGPEYAVALLEKLAVEKTPQQALV
jgi:UDP:flavonoid glycosyltransferase YjiC (YdhE family)